MTTNETSGLQSLDDFLADTPANDQSETSSTGGGEEPIVVPEPDAQELEALEKQMEELRKQEELQHNAEVATETPAEEFPVGEEPVPEPAPATTTTTTSKYKYATNSATFPPEKIVCDYSKCQIDNPLLKLTEDQRRKMIRLRQLTLTWGLKEPEQQFADDLCLFRYLKGWGWKLEEAAKRLKDACAWREKNKPQDLKLSELEGIARQGFLYIAGLDKLGRPVVCANLNRDKTPNDEASKHQKFLFVLYVMEQAIRMMPPGVYQIVFIVNLEGANVGVNLVKGSKDSFLKLGDLYCERLARLFILNLGLSLNLLWNFLKVFLPKETTEKYIFISGSKPTAWSPTFLKYIDDNVLPREFGGKSSYIFSLERLRAEETYYRQAYTEQQNAEIATREARLKEEIAKLPPIPTTAGKAGAKTPAKPAAPGQVTRPGAAVPGQVQRQPGATPTPVKKA